MIRSPRNRVHNMLRKMRSERDVSHTQEMYSDIPSTVLNTQHGGGEGRDSSAHRGSVSVRQLSQQHVSKIVVFVLWIVVLTVMFIVAGQYVDTEINTYYNTKRKTASPLLLTVVQVLFNVCLLCIPYAIACVYYPDTLFCQYYLIVAAFWVVSLHAQPHLRERFQTLFHPVPVTQEEQKNRDDQIIASLLKDAHKTTTKTPTQATHVNQDSYHRPSSVESHHSMNDVVHPNAQDRRVPIATRQRPYQSNYSVDTPQPYIADELSINSIQQNPVMFNSQDLFPTTNTQKEMEIRATNIADLF